MFGRLKLLYSTGKIDEAGLTKAVEKGFITQAEKEQIVSGS